ncbi:gluconokinase [Roseospira visakhapatnamensis]|uniref:Gluconokinase n=1 Tax=Roseospira visakhapatnamensis TaxID=390880 RepID=A0A7W6REJ8_9PROT|nr:gluconokinase [Roseospira visakhapatnamensis]MBB4267100.1 gluconokinase [Roseospira visakhapatnamensis]
MTELLWIGIDIGTTGVRAVCYRPDGTSVAAATRQYGLNAPHPGWAEQDPADVTRAAMEVLRELSATLTAKGLRPDGLAISTAFHTGIAYESDWRPVTGVMTWADMRSGQAVQDLKGDFGDVLAIYRRTGCPVNPIYPMTKIAWMRRERPDLLAKSTRFGSIKDHIFRVLTGEWVVDRSIASGSGLYNLFKAEWDRDLIAYLGITPDSLPPIVSTSHSAPLTPAVATATGLPAGLPVVIGAGDGVLVNVGIGAVRQGQMSCTIGSSGAVRMLSADPLTDPKGRTWCYNLTDSMWVQGGAINNGGIILGWLRERLTQAHPEMADTASGDIYAMMTRCAAGAPAGSGGLIMLPFLTGERAPNWNADARGILFGLTMGHTNEHIVRAVLEGVCYRMHSVAVALAEVAGPAREIRVSGNFTHSELWIQILADIFDREITVPAVDEGAAFGAAVLGFVSAGVLPDISATGDFIASKTIYTPRSAEAATYKRLFGIYERVYWNLLREFTDISAFQNG